MSAPGLNDFPPLPETLPLPVVDNHAHLDFGDRDGKRAISVETQVESAHAVGVEHIITIGCDLESARWTAQLMDRTRETELGKSLSGGIAIHPNDAARHYKGELGVGLDEAIAEVARLLDTPGMVTVGETGLDWFRTSKKDEAARAGQFESFRAHIALAKENDLPMQIHDRDAHRDVLDTLAQDGAPERTVFHCFSGDKEMATECVAKGYYLSFAGTLTFGSAEDLRTACAVTPLERILVETDSPFLTPKPYRGKNNAPYLVALTTRMVAEVKGISLEEVCRQVRENTRQVYGV